MKITVAMFTAFLDRFDVLHERACRAGPVTQRAYEDGVLPCTCGLDAEIQRCIVPVRPTARATRWRQKQRAAGKCEKCPRLACARSVRFCADHLAKQRRYSIESWRRKRDKDKPWLRRSA